LVDRGVRGDGKKYWRVKSHPRTIICG
jgi:hypothetical protein